jgi:DNA-binding NarL/FixJ family response regulator
MLSKAAPAHNPGGTVEDRGQRSARVLIVEDHPLVRHALAEVLEGRFEVVDEAGTGEEAVRKAQELDPDVVVMDVGLPDMDGLAATRRIKEERPASQVVILTASDDDRTILGAIDAGAISVVVKHEETPIILEAIDQASAQRPYFSPAIAKRVIEAALGRLEGRGGEEAEQRQRAERQRPDGRGLTAREIEVLKRVARGAHNRDIALDLAISERTVMNHLMSIYAKLGVRGRAGATAYAIKHGLITI